MPIAHGRDAKLPEFNLLIEGSDLTLHLADLITAQHVLIPHIDLPRPGPQKETTRKEEPEDHESPDAILVAIAFFHKSGFYRNPELGTAGSRVAFGFRLIWPDRLAGREVKGKVGIATRLAPFRPVDVRTAAPVHETLHDAVL